MTLQISDNRYQSTTRFKLGRVMLPAVMNSNVKTLPKTGTILLSMVTLPCYLNWFLLLSTF